MAERPVDAVFRENAEWDERARIALWWSGVLVSLPRPAVEAAEAEAHSPEDRPPDA